MSTALTLSAKTAGAALAATNANASMERFRNLVASRRGAGPRAGASASNSATRDLLASVSSGAAKKVDEAVAKVAGSASELRKRGRADAISFTGVVTEAALSFGRTEVRVAVKSTSLNENKPEVNVTEVGIDIRFDMAMDAGVKRACTDQSHPYFALQHLFHALNVELSAELSRLKLTVYSEESVAAVENGVLCKLRDAWKAHAEEMVPASQALIKDHLATFTSTYNCIPPYLIPSQADLDKKRADKEKARAAKSNGAATVAPAKEDASDIFPALLSGEELQKAYQPALENVGLLQVALHIFNAIRIRIEPYKLYNGDVVKFKLPINTQDQVETGAGVVVSECVRGCTIMPATAVRQPQGYVLPYGSLMASHAQAQVDPTAAAAEDAMLPPPAEEVAAPTASDKDAEEHFVTVYDFWQLSQKSRVITKCKPSDDAMFQSLYSEAFPTDRLPNVPTISELECKTMDRLRERGEDVNALSAKKLSWAMGEQSIIVPLTGASGSLNAQVSPNGVYLTFREPGANPEDIKAFKRTVDSNDRKKEMPDSQTEIAHRTAITGFITPAPLMAVRPDPVMVQNPDWIEGSESPKEVEKHVTVINLRSGVKSVYIDVAIYKDTLGALFGLGPEDHDAWKIVQPAMREMQGIMLMRPSADDTRDVLNNLTSVWTSLESTNNATLDELVMSHMGADDSSCEFTDPTDASRLLSAILGAQPTIVWRGYLRHLYCDPLSWLQRVGIPITADRARILQQVARKNCPTWIGSNASVAAYQLYNLSGKSIDVPELQKAKKGREIKYFVVPQAGFVSEAQRDYLVDIDPEHGALLWTDEFAKTKGIEAERQKFFNDKKVPADAAVRQLTVAHESKVTYANTKFVLYALVMRSAEDMFTEFMEISKYMPAEEMRTFQARLLGGAPLAIEDEQPVLAQGASPKKRDAPSDGERIQELPDTTTSAVLNEDEFAKLV